ncbi:C-type lectin domain family 4 member F isoform X1 [Procambarus clarkii]|uniref:C-type lectin domain family 4 member F isoform X1 n=1 Tax=Procambarus clarkii TaxID=6728 RepID=UPI0037438A2D
MKTPAGPASLQHINTVLPTHSPHLQPPLPQPPQLHPSLLQNPLMLASLLLLVGSHNPDDTHWASLRRDDHLHTLLSHNLRTINDINENLAKTLHRRQQPTAQPHHLSTEGPVEAEEPNGCTNRPVRDAPESLSSGFVPLQESVVGLQEAIVHRRMKKQPAPAVGKVLQSLTVEMERQRGRLEKLRMQRETTAHPHQARRCSEPFLVLGEECLYLSHKRKLGWHGASSVCQEMQSTLAEPANVTALAAIIRAFSGANKRYWLGASDELSEGDWRWSSGRAVRDGDWRAGQPSNTSRSGQVQDCLALVTVENNRPPLDDYSCWKKREFICQRDLHC